MAKPRVQTVEQARAAFYESARFESGLTENEIREVLLANFESFNPLRLDEYMKVLKAEGHERREKQALEDRRTALRNKMPPPPSPDPCPVEGCTGHKIQPTDGSHWEWVCSEGGLHHFLVDNISKTLRITHDKFIVKLQEKHDATAQSNQPNQT
jgi:hypothetical protein